MKQKCNLAIAVIFLFILAPQVGAFTLTFDDLTKPGVITEYGGFTFFNTAFYPAGINYPGTASDPNVIIGLDGYLFEFSSTNNELFRLDSLFVGTAFQFSALNFTIEGYNGKDRVWTESGSFADAMALEVVFDNTLDINKVRGWGWTNEPSPQFSKMITADNIKGEWSAVPEPTTFVLCVVGLLGLTGTFRKTA